MKHIGLLAVLMSSLASGAVVSVPATGLGDFVLDIDSDGFAEFKNFGFWQEENLISFGFHVDGIDLITTFPDRPFVGICADRFASKEELVASTVFTGDLVVPLGYTPIYDSIPGTGFVDGSSPLWAAWMYGSLGAGSDDRAFFWVEEFTP